MVKGFVAERKSGPVPDLYLGFPVTGRSRDGCTVHGIKVAAGISIWNVSGLSGFGRALPNERTGMTRFGLLMWCCCSVDARLSCGHFKNESRSTFPFRPSTQFLLRPGSVTASSCSPILKRAPLPLDSNPSLYAQTNPSQPPLFFPLVFFFSPPSVSLPAPETNSRAHFPIPSNIAMHPMSGLDMQKPSLSPTSPNMRSKRQRTDQPAPDGHPPPPPGAQPVGDDVFVQDGDAVDSGADEDEDEEKPKSDKKAGRRKIKIEFIQDKSRRHITFSKRKAGMLVAVLPQSSPSHMPIYRHYEKGNILSQSVKPRLTVFCRHTNFLPSLAHRSYSSLSPRPAWCTPLLLPSSSPSSPSRKARTLSRLA